MKTKTLLPLMIYVSLIGAANSWLHRNDRAFPLKSAFITFQQADMPTIPYGQDREALQNRFRGRPRDIFLVRGNDLTAAIRAIAPRIPDGEAAENVFDCGDGQEHQTHWLACYLGTTGSSPPAMRIQSIRLEQKALRIRYA